MEELKHTTEDLKTMQAWPSWKKIQVTQAKIIEWYTRYDGMVNISISGGKDSSCLLDLARRCFPDIEAVYVNIGLDFPSVRQLAMSTPNVTVLKPEKRFDEIVKEYGWCYPNKETAHTIYYARKGSKWALERMQGINRDGTPSKYRQSHYARWAHLVDCEYTISSRCCEFMKERPLEKYRKESGKQPIIGVMASESERRKQAWLKTGCNNFNSKKPVSKPLSAWTEQDILTYIRDYKIPIASEYGDIIEDSGDIIEDSKGKLRTTGEKRTGCVFCPTGVHLDKINRFQRMAQTHPKLHNYCMNSLGLGEFLDFIGVSKE